MAGTRQGGGSLRKCAEAGGCIVRGGVTALAPRGALLIWRCLGGTGEAMAALCLAAGRVGVVATMERGGLADATGGLVEVDSLAQPAMVGTVRLFREPARAVSLLAGRWGEGGGRVRAVPIHRHRCRRPEPQAD